jgi:hypothetical protein
MQNVRIIAQRLEIKINRSDYSVRQAAFGKAAQWLDDRVLGAEPTGLEPAFGISRGCAISAVNRR